MQFKLYKLNAPFSYDVHHFDEIVDGEESIFDIICIFVAPSKHGCNVQGCCFEAREFRVTGITNSCLDWCRKYNWVYTRGILCKVMLSLCNILRMM